VGWGAVWAGVLTALALFVFLELIFFAFGWLTLDPGDNSQGPSESVAWMTGLAGLVAFTLGGVVSAACHRRRTISAGLLHGSLVWALTVTAIMLLTLLGGGALFGALSSVIGQISVVQNALGSGNVDVSGAESQARDAAQSAVFALAVFLAAAAAGGALGAKLWPGRSSTEGERHAAAH